MNFGRRDQSPSRRRESGSKTGSGFGFCLVVRVILMYQDGLPEQQEHFLHGEVRCVHAAELGHHGEEEQGEGFSVVQRGAFGEAGQKESAAALLFCNHCAAAHW